MERQPGESLKAWKRRIAAERHVQMAPPVPVKVRRRRDAIYRHAQRVYDEIDRSPDSDPHDRERPTF